MSLTFTVYAANDLNGSAIATFSNLVMKGIRIEDNGPGAGMFRINRDDPQAVVANLAQGNYVRVTRTEVDASPIFGFFLDEGDFDLVSAQERGAEVLEFRGMGPLGYLRRAVMWNHSYVTKFTGDPDDITDTGPVIGSDPFGGIARLYAAGSGNKAGQILGRLVGEARAFARPQHPLPELTIDWDYATDSNGSAWATTTATAEFSADIGENYLNIVLRLIPTGLHVNMTPDFLLQAWNSYGTDRSATISFHKAVNIVDPPGLQRQLLPSRRVTNILVSGEDESYGAATLADASLGVIEGYMTSFGTTTGTLDDIGTVELNQRLIRSDSVKFGVLSGSDPGNGLWEPGPPGSTSGDYWVGDIVELDTNNDSVDGSGYIDFAIAPLRVAAINISEDVAGNQDIELELNSVWNAVADAGPANRDTSGSSTVVPGAGGGTSGGSTTVAPHTHRLSTLTDVTLTSPALDDNLTYDGSVWVNGLVTGAHSHSSEQYTAAGGTPETLTLSDTPLSLVAVYRNGVRVPLDEVGGSGTSLDVDTTAGDIVIADYVIAP